VIVAQTLEHRARSGEQPGFRRDVGLVALTFVSLGSIIGSGWLLAVRPAATAAGGASVLSWALAGLIIVPLALVHSELGAAYPVTGGTARWPRLAFGSLGGFTAGWVAWIQAVTLAPIEVEATLGYLDRNQQQLINQAGALTPTGLGVAAGLMLAFTVINILGVRWLVESNGIAVLWKIFVPVVTIIVLVTVSFRATNFTAGGGFAPYGAHGVLAALPLGVLFALNGFEQAVQMGSEARSPQRNVPRAVIGAVVVSTALYLALQVAFIGALNPGNLVHGWANPVTKGTFEPYATLATGLGLGWLAVILYINSFISPAGTGLIYMGVSARLSYALGHSGYAPKGVSLISNRGVPLVSIFLAFAVGLSCLLPFPSWQDLVSLITSSTVIMYAFAPITLLALRKSDPDRDRPYRLPAAPVLAPLAFVVANESIYWTSWTVVERLMLVIAAGYVIFGISYARGPQIKRAPVDLRSLVWILPWFTGLAVISYFGQYGGTKLIPEWVDLGVVAAFSLVIFYLAVWLRLPSQRVAVAVEADKLEPIYPRPRALLSTDLPFTGGIVRQLRYDQSGELAVLDASAEVVAVNWTARVGPAAFVSEIDRIISLDDNMRVVLLVSPDPGIQETTMSSLRHMILADKTFDTVCEFVRLDLSTAQSAFWEKVPHDDLTVVGFGGDTGTFTEETVGLVGRLLTATATPAINFDEVLSSLRTLARQYTYTNREHPDDRGHLHELQRQGPSDSKYAGNRESHQVPGGRVPSRRPTSSQPRHRDHQLERSGIQRGHPRRMSDSVRPVPRT
jgi:amino acid transporter